MKVSVKSYILGLCVTSLTMASCEYKLLDDYYYPDGGVKQSILLDWDYARIDSVPGSFRVALYPADMETGGKVPEGVILFDVYNNQAILNDVPSGYYNVTAWNTDTEHNIIRNMTDRDNINAGTTTYWAAGANPAGVLDSLYYGQPIYDTPEYMVHANKDLFHVVPDKLDQPMTLTPDSMCVAIDYRIHGIAALHLANEVRAAVNNVTKTRLLAFDNVTRDTCVIMSECLRNPSDSLIHGRFFVYGMEPEDFLLLPHTMTLFFWMDNKNVFFPISINKFLKPYSRDDRVIYLDIPDIALDLRKYASSGSFDVSVGDWEDVEEDIEW